jgi:hypothetical protein
MVSLAKQQYSGNAGRTINGIGIVTCVYVNPALDRYWLIDYRIYDKQGDGKSKLDHVRDMLSVLVYSRTVAFSTVLMDSWYASKSLLLYIESLDKSTFSIGVSFVILSVVLTNSVFSPEPVGG